MAHLASAETPTPQLAADRWTAYSVTVWAICMLGFAFDIYEATITIMPGQESSPTSASGRSKFLARVDHSDARGPKVRRLFAGGKQIRTAGPTCA
jgi:hypothetical protein